MLRNSFKNAATWEKSSFFFFFFSYQNLGVRLIHVCAVYTRLYGTCTGENRIVGIDMIRYTLDILYSEPSTLCRAWRCKSCNRKQVLWYRVLLCLSYRQLRVRRALLQDVPLRTRRTLSLYKVNGNSALLVLNGTSLSCNNALLALSWRYAVCEYTCQIELRFVVILCCVFHY